MKNTPQTQAKLERARALIVLLDEKCKAYIHSDNFRVERIPIAPNEWDLYLRLHEAPPLEFGVLIGDIVHNLMSSLDIAFFHYLRESNPESFSVLSERELTRIHFPVFDSEEYFVKTGWHGNLAEPQLLVDLREVQPFRNLEFAESKMEEIRIIQTTPLMELLRLWNADKHRGVNVVVGGLDMLMLGLEEGQKSIWTLRDSPPWQDGSKIYTVKVDTDSIIPDLNLSETFAIGLESDVKPLQIYPIISKLEALFSQTEYCHFILKRWFSNR
jgi:hypothetical protein